MNGNAKETSPERDNLEAQPCPPSWPQGHWWHSGWQLSFELERVYNEVEKLTRELDQLLQSGFEGYEDRRSELGSRLARFVALAAGFSEQLLLEGDRLHHDD